MWPEGWAGFLDPYRHTLSGVDSALNQAILLGALENDPVTVVSRAPLMVMRLSPETIRVGDRLPNIRGWHTSQGAHGIEEKGKNNHSSV